MKTLISIICSVVLLISLLSACGTDIAKPTETAESGSTAPTEKESVNAPTETAAKVDIGTVDDYVSEAETRTIIYNGEVIGTAHIPEIKLDSEDARITNEEIRDKILKELENNDTGFNSVDYEAGLRNTVLSVFIEANVDGGNVYGLCYDLDVVSGESLKSDELCAKIGVGYSDVLNTVRNNLTVYYDEKYSSLPDEMNKTYREKTISNDNLLAAKLYVNKEGKLMAMTDIYATVGGGHWIAKIEAE